MDVSFRFSVYFLIDLHCGRYYPSFRRRAQWQYRRDPPAHTRWRLHAEIIEMEPFSHPNPESPAEGAVAFSIWPRKWVGATL
ncbi:MAG TPA: hypothetical protein DEW46_00910 [Verrucomicrobia bacterium]|nr:hypothetical protein [Verrucomicrobiota bacterium]